MKKYNKEASENLVHTMTMHTFGKPISEYELERTSLEEASRGIIDSLIKGANPNIFNTNGDVVWVRFVELIEFDSDDARKVAEWIDTFLSFGGDIEKKNRRRIKPLYHFAYNHRILSVIELVKRGADVEDHVDSLIVEICGRESYKREDHLIVLEALNLLVERGLNPCVLSKDRKRSAITEAARCGNIVVVERLLELGCDVNQKTANGGTPLMYACGPVETNSWSSFNNRNDIETIEILLKNGADPTIRSNQKRSAISIARSEHGFEKERLERIENIFKKHGV